MLARAGVALDTQALKSKGRPGTVSQQALAAGGVGAVDADGGVEAEAAAGLPGEHVLDGVLVEEAAALEEPEHAALQRALEVEDVVAGEVGRLVEGDAAVVALGEDAVEDDDVEVEVRIKGGAEAVQEGDGAEPGVARSGRAGAVQRGADAPEQDAEQVAGEARVVGQEGADPLRQGEYPLADGQRRQDVVGEVGGHLHHAACIAGGADAAALAREGDEALGGARVAADTGEAVGQDAAAKVGAEVVLDPLRYAVAVGVGRCGVGEEGLEMVLDERVERRGGGIAAAVDGGETVGPRWGRWVREGAAGCGPVGAGRRGRGHAREGTAAAGAVEWRAGQAARTPGLNGSESVAPGRPAVTDHSGGLLTIALLVSTALVLVFWRDYPPASIVNVDTENTPAAWFSAMLLLAAALAMLVCGILDLRASHSRSERLLGTGWFFGAALFAFLSLDELGSLHDRSGHIARAIGYPDFLQVDAAGWVERLAIPIAVVGALILAFVLTRMRRSPGAAALMIGGLLLLLSVPIHEHLEVSGRVDGVRRPASAILLEEGTELGAFLCFFAGALWYAAVRARVLGWDGANGRVVPIRIRMNVVVAVEVVLGLALLFAYFVLPQVLNIRDGRGIPHNWFPAALAMVVALLCLHLATLPEKRAGGLPAIWLILFGLAHVALSVDHAWAHTVSERLWRATPVLRIALDVAMAGGLLILVAWGWMRTVSPAMRIALAGWLALQLLAFVAGIAQRPLLAYGAYALLLPVLLGLLRPEPRGTRVASTAPRVAASPELCHMRRGPRSRPRRAACTPSRSRAPPPREQDP